MNPTLTIYVQQYTSSVQVNPRRGCTEDGSPSEPALVLKQYSQTKLAYPHMAPLCYMGLLVGSLSTPESLSDVMLHIVETAEFRDTGKFWLPLCTLAL